MTIKDFIRKYKGEVLFFIKESNADVDIIKFLLNDSEYKNIVSDVIENFGNKPKKTVRVDSKKINDIIGNENFPVYQKIFIQSKEIFVNICKYFVIMWYILIFD